MTTFVTVATCYACTHIATALRRASHTDLSLTRDTSSPRARAPAAAGIRPVAGDITDPDTYRHHVEDADTVVHTVLDMNYPVGTDTKLFAKLRAAQDRTGRTRHLIYTTGVSSYGRTGISLLDEEPPGQSRQPAAPSPQPSPISPATADSLSPTPPSRSTTAA
ncbi:NmrA family NAD(P)-binding protein [Streptomyces inhibens]|uniref:NmrA family NAD(P)-binding protein n=1 Tax=Streptomyces inhibens TaxID=2293571 RepID=UPI0015F26925|nr:NmrA family NAD(P)-binding protein [Streptomyces inhibens]